ncbi:hypothetical protein VTL71DRAFT_6416 [Oculimacula yallundae]|uniref:N-acetyltransferase domain-containing protein n=1 Tax=Oculimacula yallundae TaxID=86028 RepID=A0ABR4BWW5_9HELO
MSTSEPKGDIVTKPPALYPDSSKSLIGQHGIVLIPTTKSHIPGLFKSVCGPKNDNLWTYMTSGPHRTLEVFSTHITALLNNPDWFIYTIFPSSSSSSNEATSETPLGLTSYLAIVPSHLSIEIGHVLYSPLLQRTPASTEATFLLMRYAFEELGYVRVVWKANSWNEGSRRAARRLGFVEEGTFRKHLVMKGRRRDSVWFSCIDDEWFLQGKGGVKAGLEGWLEKSNFDEEGKQIRKLEDIRKGLEEVEA